MNKSTKAILLSALIFPGAGHFLLKKYLAGALLAGLGFTALIILLAKTVEIALNIGEKIQNGEVQFDAVTIAALVSHQASGSEAQLLNIATAVLFIAWIIGIVDSYRVGRAQEKTAS